MAMRLKTTAFSNRDIQHVIQIIKMYKDAGITDTEEIRKDLSGRIHTPSKMIQALKPKTQLRCPECNFPLYSIINFDGLDIVGCKNCRYSRIK